MLALVCTRLMGGGVSRGFADLPQPNSSHSHTPSLEFARPTLERRREADAGRAVPDRAAPPQHSLSAAL